MIDVFALTTRGLEAISAGEMTALPSLQIRQVGYRRIAARYAGPAADLLTLRTVDDVFLDLAEWRGISQHKDALAKLQQLSTQLDLWQALGVRSQLESALAGLNEPPAFSITANFVGKRNYSTEEIKQAVAAGIESTFGWIYQSDDQLSNFNIRLFIEHETAFVGMRLGHAPLYKRSYKQEHVPGSLKPSVANALLRLADLPAGSLVLDPFCGAGTILIEAACLGAVARGGDHDPAALAAARANASAAGIDVHVQRWDTRTLPLDDSSVHGIVTNLPWGRQIEVNEALAGFYQEVCMEMQRVLAVNGRIVLLTNVPQFVTFDALQQEKQIEISVFGQTPTVMLFSKPALAARTLSNVES